MEISKEEIDLGVLSVFPVFFNDLKVEDQCLKAAKSANKVLGMVKRTFQCRNKKVMLILYKTLIEPLFDYCTQVWGPYLKKRY